MLRDFTPRLYQQTILGTAAAKNTLVVLPTGLGKTGIALLLAVQRLQLYPMQKILLLSPTKPLCEQHRATFQKHLDLPSEKIVLFTGSVAPEKRGELWQEAQVVISTPQGLENDVINRRVKLEEVSLLIVDEAHHSTGEYSYVWLAQQYDKVARYPRILALTASPGSDLEKIKEICQSLKIEKIEVRTDKDPDVQPYVQPIHLRWVKVDFPEEFVQIRTRLENCKKSKLLEAQRYGYCHNPQLMKGELLDLQGQLQGQLSSGERDFGLLRSVSLVAEALKVEHALELLETQGIPQLNAYITKLRGEAAQAQSKAVKNLMLDENFKAASYLVEQLFQSDFPHPKLPKLQEIVQQELEHNPTAKIIIFTQFRNSADLICKRFTSVNISNSIFVGQAKKEGLGFSQRQQKEIIDKFAAGEFRLLVATSVAEEGLDIPKVDKVIFYEPVPSAIRSIQRRGRTGRLEKGEVTILITNSTRDVGFRWSAHHKEKQMYRNLEQLKKGLLLLPPEISASSGILSSSAPLSRFIPEQQLVAVLADHREKDNKIVKELMEMGVAVRTGQLAVADYLVSGRVAVELKHVPDFVASIIDGRLLEQVRALKKNFDKAVVIIEGEEDIYTVRKVHANAIRGMLSSIVLDFGVPVLYTKNAKDTAGLLAVMAKREQEKNRDFSYPERKPHTLQEQQEFLLSSLPGIGVVTAKNLLAHFGSIKKVMIAEKEELMNVEGIGEKTAQRLQILFKEEYKKE
ncbi:MAG: DEAD/DEAH box helicase [Nanoarchaeota archaeon]